MMSDDEEKKLEPESSGDSGTDSSSVEFERIIPAADDEEGRRLAPTVIWAFTVICSLVLIFMIIANIGGNLRDALIGSAGRLGERVGDKVTSLFKEADITPSFQSYVLKNRKVQQLVLYEQTRYEVERRVLSRWNSRAVLEIRTPVKYNYYVDLAGEWQLKVRDGFLEVVAPEIKVKEPAVDLSRMESNFQSGYLIFGEDKKLEQLKKDFYPIIKKRAASPEYINEIREEARVSLGQFIKGWIVENGFLNRYGIDSVMIRFRDESGMPAMNYSVRSKKAL